MVNGFSTIFHWKNLSLCLHPTEINENCFRYYRREPEGVNELIKHWLLCDRIWWTSTEQVCKANCSWLSSFQVFCFSLSKTCGLDCTQRIWIAVFSQGNNQFPGCQPLDNDSTCGTCWASAYSSLHILDKHNCDAALHSSGDHFERNAS